MPGSLFSTEQILPGQRPGTSAVDELPSVEMTAVGSETYSGKGGERPGLPSIAAHTGDKSEAKAPQAKTTLEYIKEQLVKVWKFICERISDLKENAVLFFQPYVELCKWLLNYTADNYQAIKKRWSTAYNSIFACQSSSAQKVAQEENGAELAAQGLV